MAGIYLLTIGEILGRRDLRMTKRYAHIASAHKLAAVEKLEKRIENRLPKKLMQVWQQNRLMHRTGSKFGSKHQERRYLRLADSAEYRVEPKGIEPSTS